MRDLCRPEGNIYEGEWFDGKQHGKGWYTSKNGERREGIWENGKRIKWLDEAENKGEMKVQKVETENDVNPVE